MRSPALGWAEDPLRYGLPFRPGGDSEEGFDEVASVDGSQYKVQPNNKRGCEKTVEGEGGKVLDVAREVFKSGNPDDIRNEVTAEVLMEFMI